LKVCFRRNTPRQNNDEYVTIIKEENIGSAYSAARKYVHRSWEYINRSQTYRMDVKIGTEAVQFLFWEHIDEIFLAVRLVCGQIHCCQMAEFWAAGLKNGPVKLLAP
jgi:hypothetical protein